MCVYASLATFGICFVLIAMGLGESMRINILYPLTLDLGFFASMRSFIHISLCTPASHELLFFGKRYRCSCSSENAVTIAIGLSGFTMLLASTFAYKVFILPNNTGLQYRYITQFSVSIVTSRTCTYRTLRGNLYSFLLLPSDSFVRWYLGCNSPAFRF